MDEICYRYKVFDGLNYNDMSRCLWPEFKNVEADTCIVLLVKHAYELIFQPSIDVKRIYIDVLTILRFHTNNKGLVVLG